MDVSFSSLTEFRAVLNDCPPPSESAKTQAIARNNDLTKPPGALGRLEQLAIWCAQWQGNAKPRLSNPQVLIFAANHGVAARGVSAFPPEVTAQMVLNFQSGGAAINQLAIAFGAKLEVHPLALEHPTNDFTDQPAMSEQVVVESLLAGWIAVDPTADLVIAGEMGIGNTTSAAAMSMALFGGQAKDWTGRGTGVDDAALKAKTRVVGDGVKQQGVSEPLEVLRCLGGREIAAITGVIAKARYLGIPLLLDGFICTTAAAVLFKLAPDLIAHTMASHVSAESAHRRLLDRIKKQPILDLGLRLGEGSGAAVALPILQAAIACHSGMATFSEAGVSDSDS